MLQKLNCAARLLSRATRIGIGVIAARTGITRSLSRSLLLQRVTAGRLALTNRPAPPPLAVRQLATFVVAEAKDERPYRRRPDKRPGILLAEGSTSPRVAKCSLIRRNDRLPNRPKCDAGELEMRPGKWDSDDGHGKKNRHDDMAERQPPPREHQPYDVSHHPKWSGADVLIAGIVGARNRFLAKR